jgi:cell division septation protein DedD
MAWQLFDAWPDRALMPVDAGDAHAIAGAYDAYFDDVFDLASRLSASKEEAAAIARAATVRLFEGRMVRGRGDDGARFVAGAYHEAATMSERATQPVSAGTHTLAPELVDAVNAHVARCRTCRRWGPIEGAAQPRAGRSEPELKAQIWREVAPVVEAPARSFEPHSDARRLAARAELSTDHRRWLGVAGAAGLVALAAIVVGALAVGGGGDGGDGRANLEAFASSGDERTPTPASTSGGGASASDTSNATSGSADERSAGDDAVPRDGDSVADDAASGPDGSIGTGAGTGDADCDGIVDAPSSRHGPDAGSGAGGSSGDTNSQSGGGANECAPGVTTPAPPSGEPTTASAPAATSTPAPVSTPPPASTPVPVATATSAPPPPPPTQPPGPPPPEPTSVIDLLPVVPTVVGALPTLPPVLGEGG